MLKEFKAFILTGNLIELSIAVILAGAVGKVVTGFTNFIMMPIIGFFTGGTDFSDKKVILVEAKDAVMDGETVVTEAITENAIMWGAWVNDVISLVIVGFVLFMVVKAYNKTKKPVEVAPAAPKGPSQEDLLAEIRDLLKK